MKKLLSAILAVAMIFTLTACGAPAAADDPAPDGENIDASRATASQAINFWMNSPPHKAHILNDSITRVGVGYFYSSDSEWKHYWVMLSSY